MMKNHQQKLCRNDYVAVIEGIGESADTNQIDIPIVSIIALPWDEIFTASE